MKSRRGFTLAEVLITLLFLAIVLPVAMRGVSLALAAASHAKHTREATARVLAKTDPHSSGKWRIDGSVQNFPEFGKAFSCKVGQPMMPANSCRVW